jgi:hypothetical protein
VGLVAFLGPRCQHRHRSSGGAIPCSLSDMQPPTTARHLRALATAGRRLAAAQAEVARQRQVIAQLACAMRDAGTPVRVVAATTGLQRQAVYYLMSSRAGEHEAA